MQLSCFFTLKRSYQSIKHESQFGQEGEAQSNAPATSARPPPRSACGLSTRCSQRRSHVCSLLFGLVMSHYPSPFSGFKRKCAHTGTRRSEPRVASRERRRRRVSRFEDPTARPTLFPQETLLRQSHHGWRVRALPRCGAPGTAPAPLLPEAPYQCPPAPHRSAVRRGVGGAPCDVPGIVSHSEARLRADRRLSARPG